MFSRPYCMLLYIGFGSGGVVDAGFGIYTNTPYAWREYLCEISCDKNIHHSGKQFHTLIGAADMPMCVEVCLPSVCFRNRRVHLEEVNSTAQILHSLANPDPNSTNGCPLSN